uniref:O-methyltransferase C-terminal domain-containing protein n=1 Tax=Oryza glaberrima TaxID=4538 RepID=I1Q6Z9_ORYGL
MTNMKMISPIKADEDVGGGKDNDTNQSRVGIAEEAWFDEDDGVVDPVNSSVAVNDNDEYVLHCFGDDDCVKILRRCKDAIPTRDAGGKVIIINIVVGSGSQRDIFCNSPKI